MNVDLIEIGTAVAPSPRAVLALEEAGWHVSDKLPVTDGIGWVKLPACAADLEPIDYVWAHLRTATLAQRPFDGRQDVVDACCYAWNSFVADAKTLRSIPTRRRATCRQSWRST